MMGQRRKGRQESVSAGCVIQRLAAPRSPFTILAYSRARAPVPKQSCTSKVSFLRFCRIPPECPEAPRADDARSSQGVEPGPGPQDVDMDEGNEAFDAQVAKDFAQIAVGSAAEAVAQEAAHEERPSEQASGSGPTPMEKCEAEKMTS